MAGGNGRGIESEVLVGAKGDRGAFDGVRSRIEVEITGEDKLSLDFSCNADRIG